MAKQIIFANFLEVIAWAGAEYYRADEIKGTEFLLLDEPYLPRTLTNHVQLDRLQDRDVLMVSLVEGWGVRFTDDGVATPWLVFETQLEMEDWLDSRSARTQEDVCVTD